MVEIMEKRFEIPEYDNPELREYCEELKGKYDLNRRILFVKGPQLNLNAFEPVVAQNRCYYAYPPTGLQYLSQAIEGRGLETRILDLNFEFLKRIRDDKDFDFRNWINMLDDYLKKHKPTIIGVSNSFAVDKPSLMEILNYLKDKDKIVLAGGQNATYEGESLLEKGLCHFVFQREAENKINFLLDNLYEYRGNKPVPGILFMHNGRIKETKGEEDVVQLKGNLINAHRLVPIEEYPKVGSLSPFSRMSGRDKVFATVLVNRGCEGGCRFCGVCDYMGRGVRTRNIKDALDEVEYLYKQREVRHIEILDDDFAKYREKADEFLQGLIDRGIDITWASNNGFIARTLDRKLMEKMRESGCLGFKIGVESGNAERLREIRKPGSLKLFREFSKIAQDFPEMIISDYYILGFPNEKFGETMETFKFSLEMNLDWSVFSVYQPNVNYFGDDKKREEKKDNLIGDFLPAKDSMKGQLKSCGVLSGLNVFNFNPEEIASREQLTQAWFSFDFLRNFVLNKNLTSSGNPEKLVSWVSALELRYPSQAHINFTLGLGNTLLEREEERKRELERLRENLKDNYWRGRFEEFGLIDVVNNFPENPAQVEEVMESLRERYTALF